VATTEAEHPQSVSVVICAHTVERWDSTMAAVRSCLDQSRRPDEVVLVIDHNKELFERATATLGDATVVENRGPKGLSGSRNTGIVTTSGSIVAFLDDDAVAAPDWIAQILLPFEDGSVAGVGGWVLPAWEDRCPEWFPETYYWVFGCSYAGLPDTNDSIRNPIGTNMALRRTVFALVGGFNSALGRIGKVPLGCEETELCVRYARRFPQERFVLRREAVVHHFVPASRLRWRYFWRRCWSEGLSKAAVASLHPHGSGFVSERGYLEHALPREVVTDLRSLPRHPVRVSIRSGLMFAGTVFAGAGLLKGRRALRAHPVDHATENLALFSDPPPGGSGRGEVNRDR